jgi:hypothetical protein
LQNKINNWRNRRNSPKVVGIGEISKNPVATGSSQQTSNAIIDVSFQPIDENGFYRPESWASSLERYLQSPELSASLIDIENAVRNTRNENNLSPSEASDDYYLSQHQSNKVEIPLEKASLSSCGSSVYGSSVGSMWSCDSMQSA